MSETPVPVILAYSPFHGHSMLVSIKPYKDIEGLAQVIDRTDGPRDYPEAVAWARRRVAEINEVSTGLGRLYTLVGMDAPQPAPARPVLDDAEWALIRDSLRYRAGIMGAERGTAPMAEERRATSRACDALADKLTGAQPAPAEAAGDREAVESCSVCAGTGRPVSGRPCICGGAGTLYAEAQGLREALYDATQRPTPAAPAPEAGRAGDDDGRCTGMVDYPQPEGGTLPLRCGNDAGHAGPCSPAIAQFSRWNTMRLVRRGY